MYLPKLTRPIFSTKMSRFAPACPVIFIWSDLSLSRTPWGTYMNCNKRKKTITTENQKYPAICFFNLHEEIKSDKGKSKETPFPFPLLHVSTDTHKELLYQHSHFSTSNGCASGFWCTWFTKTKFPNLVQWLKRFCQYQWFKDGFIFQLCVHQYLVLFIPIPTTQKKMSFIWTQRWWESIQAKY